VNACSVNCYTCGRCVWEGGRHQRGELIDVPFEDGQEALTAYADAHCTRTDCPHTTVSVAAAAAQRPEVLAQQVAELRAQLAALFEAH
jgi:hypothetical protein